MKMFYVPTSEISASSIALEQRYSSAQRICGIRNFHSLLPNLNTKKLQMHQVSGSTNEVKILLNKNNVQTKELELQTAVCSLHL